MRAGWRKGRTIGAGAPAEQAYGGADGTAEQAHQRSGKDGRQAGVWAPGTWHKAGSGVDGTVAAAGPRQYNRQTPSFIASGRTGRLVYPYYTQTLSVLRDQALLSALREPVLLSGLHCLALLSICPARSGAAIYLPCATRRRCQLAPRLLHSPA